MAKMYIMKGLPASGKSTRAEEIIKKTGNTVRLNKDLIRTMLHFDKFTGRNEGLTRDAARALAMHFLTSGINVIIDDTNLNEGTLQSWKDLAKKLGAKIEYGDLTGVPYQDCIRRDMDRDKYVGKEVIINMGLKSGIIKFEKPVIICDLDGTLCNISHRLHLVNKEVKDWKAFYEALEDDEVNPEVGSLVKEYFKTHDVVFVSGRPETYKDQTVMWLMHNGFYDCKTLIMRGAGDSRPDDEVKEDILNTYFKDKSKIELVIDDRPRVIRMWERNGLKVKDVGAGIEF